MAFSHLDLASYYMTNARLLKIGYLSLTELKNMTPYERDIYIELFTQLAKEEAEERERQSRNHH